MMTHDAGGAGADEPGGTAGQPFLRFYHPEALRTRTLAVLDALEAAEDPTRHRKALADVAMELTESGLNYYFVKAVEDARAGFMAEQSTRLGISGILRVMGPVSRRVIGGMGAPQLLSVSDHIRRLMR